VKTSARRLIIAGNWKMHTDLVEGASLVAEVIERTESLALSADLVLCPPFTHLTVAATQLSGSSISLGAQHMHDAPEGAYTGEVSARMLLTSGCGYVILGHSERRTYFGETNESVNGKVRSAISAGLTPIVCVGETLEDREAGRTEEVVSEQVRAGLSDTDPGTADGLVLAYEPVWAIGTGRVATPDQADQVHSHLRKEIADLFDDDFAGRIRIQYGGSVKPENAGALMSRPNIDGALVGGASLDATSFEAIVRAGLGINGG
jgi:triosephosphate isomerase